jgi:hypothetical protein
MNVFEQDVAEFLAEWSLKHSPCTAETYYLLALSLLGRHSKPDTCPP